MTKAEEIDFGFKHIGNLVLLFLGSIFMSCFAYALLSLTHVIDELGYAYQGLIFIIFLLTFFGLFFWKHKGRLFY